MASATSGRFQWTTWAPLLAMLLLVLTWGRKPGTVVLVLVAVLLGAAVLSAVHHAEVVALKVGEPFGSLVLAVAVTVIEVGLIVTLVLAGGTGVETLARDTVFAAVMITLNGIIGISLLTAAFRRDMAVFNAEGSGAALATVVTLATLTMVVPNFTTSAAGPEFSSSQLAFAAVASLGLYVLFVITQTVRHRDFFLPVEKAEEREGLSDDDGDGHADPPTTRETLLSLALLTVALVSVVGLAKVVSPAIEKGVAELGFPQAVVGVVIALLVLLPESIAAVRASARGRVQISMNLAFGSAMASIGLTVPVIAVLSPWLDTPLHLGLEPLHIVLLLVSVVVATLTVVPGRATRMHAAINLALFAAYLFLTVQP